MLVVGCFLFFGAPFLRAVDLANEFNAANRLYEQGQYSAAAAAYQQLIERNPAASALHFNLGNARFKSGQTGRAIAAYRAAQRLAPRDPDIRANLQFARSQITGGNSVRASRTSRMVTQLTVNEWAVLASIALWLWFMLLALGEWRRGWKKAFRGYTLTLALLFLVLSAGLALAARETLLVKKSVVIAPEAVVRRGPFEESQSSFSLRDGTEVIVLDAKDDWFQVVDGAKRVGWLPKRHLAAL